MNWKQKVKKEVGENKYPTLMRIKAGKILMVIVALPIRTSLLGPVAAALMIPIKPSLWAADKIRYFKEWRTLR